MAVTNDDEMNLFREDVIYHLPVSAIVSSTSSQQVSLSAGQKVKELRWYSWTRVALANPKQAGWKQWLLVGQTCDEPYELTYFHVFAPEETLIETMIAVAGRRWTVEESLELSKGEVGLDQYEVRHWTGWYRHITLAMLALAYLAVVRSRAKTNDKKRDFKS